MIERYPRFICVNKFPLWITEKSGTPSVIFLELFFTICAARAISRNKQTIIIYFFIFALCRMERCILIRLHPNDFISGFHANHCIHMDLTNTLLFIHTLRGFFHPFLWFIKSHNICKWFRLYLPNMPYLFYGRSPFTRI